jgi:glyoxylase-like metal-dependent hydrolase (beta-lactamase superfamily II)
VTGAQLPVAEGWFRQSVAGGGVTLFVERYIDELLESNVWHVRGRDRDLLVDTANGIGALRPFVDPLTSGRPLVAVATHGHFDHSGGLHEFDDRRCHPHDEADVREPFRLRLRREDFDDDTVDMYAYYDYPVPDLVIRALPAADFDVAGWTTPGAEPTSLVAEGDVVDLGDRAFEVLHTPGHTAGSISLWESESGTLFSGDAIYVGDRLSWDDREAFLRSLERIRRLPVEVVHAGHGRTFGREDLHATIAAELAAPDDVQDGA